MQADIEHRGKHENGKDKKWEALCAYNIRSPACSPLVFTRQGQTIMSTGARYRVEIAITSLWGNTSSEANPQANRAFAQMGDILLSVGVHGRQAEGEHDSRETAPARRRRWLSVCLSGSQSKPMVVSQSFITGPDTHTLYVIACTHPPINATRIFPYTLAFHLGDSITPSAVGRLCSQWLLPHPFRTMNESIYQWNAKALVRPSGLARHPTPRMNILPIDHFILLFRVNPSRFFFLGSAKGQCNSHLCQVIKCFLYQPPLCLRRQRSKIQKGPKHCVCF
jgi:hypothetical protein